VVGSFAFRERLVPFLFSSPPRWFDRVTHQLVVTSSDNVEGDSDRRGSDRDHHPRGVGERG